jgi:hypothetical protein
MSTNSIAENIENLHRAAIEVARGFEQIKGKPRDEQADALRQASAALIEMRRACDDLAHRLKPASVPPRRLY